MKTQNQKEILSLARELWKNGEITHEQLQDTYFYNYISNKKQ